MSKKFLSYIATDLTNMLKLPKGKPTTLQTHHVDSTLKRRGNGRFHVVST